LRDLGNASGIVICNNLSRYEPSAMFVPSPDSPLTGDKAIRTAMSQMLSSNPSLEITGSEIHIVEGIALVINDWKMTWQASDGSVFSDHGRSSVVMRRRLRTVGLANGPSVALVRIAAVPALIIDSTVKASPLATGARCAWSPWPDWTSGSLDCASSAAGSRPPDQPTQQIEGEPRGHLVLLGSKPTA
jgi:hypothetical protein